MTDQCDTSKSGDKSVEQPLNTDNAEEAIVIKPVRKKRPYRSKIEEQSEQNDDSVIQEVKEITNVLLEMRELQKLRQRTKGIEASTSDAVELKPTVKHDARETTALDSTFTTQVGLYNPVDLQLEQFLKEKLKKKEEVVEVPKRNEEDDLYRIPEELQVKKPKLNDKADAASLMTGIVEVELPVEYKLKNIEETETARKKMEETMLQLKEQEVNTQMFRIYKEKNNGLATDDAVLERFKKRFQH